MTIVAVFMSAHVLGQLMFYDSEWFISGHVLLRSMTCNVIEVSLHIGATNSLVAGIPKPCRTIL